MRQGTLGELERILLSVRYSNLEREHDRTKNREGWRERKRVAFDVIVVRGECNLSRRCGEWVATGH